MMYLVVGSGKSGKSAISFLDSLGYPALSYEDGNSEPDLSKIGSVILSPGIPQTHPLIKKAISLGIEVIGEMELACRHLKCKAVGITGTNGKTTTTLMTAHVLNNLGFSAHALGNVGIPLSSCVAHLTENEIAVLEFSSFQLETMSAKVLDAALILNITPDHLDRYSGIEEYAKAKLKIANCLKPSAPLFVEQNTFNEFSLLFNHKSLETFSVEGYTVKQINQAASQALCGQFHVSQEQFDMAVRDFNVPMHRLEKVANIDGVDYYNDSKATNCAATVKAVHSVPGRIFLIAGGVAKGQHFGHWSQAFGEKVAHIFVIGEAALQIQEEVKGMRCTVAGTLSLALRLARAHAKAGDTILLSPGCASLDQYANYSERGEAFKKMVKE